MHQSKTSADLTSDRNADLAAFIRQNINPILQRWTAVPYAGTDEASGVNILFQFHSEAEALLLAAARELGGGAADSATQLASLNICAESCAYAQLTAGLSESQLVLTLQALRRIVLQLWAENTVDGGARDIEAILRLNQIFDHAVATAVDHYEHIRDRCHGLFLKTLAHDLRNPLAGLELTSQLLQENGKYAMGRMHKIAANIAYAVGNAAKIAGYIHDVGNLRTGLGLPIKPALLDIDALCKGVVEKIMLRFPDHALHFEGSTFLEGCFDEARITQAFAGVIAYALDQCAANDPVSVKLHADGDTLVFSVRYVAAEMEEAQTMFDPMRRYALHVLSTKEPLSTLGIDLYIAREIVTAHDGEIRAYANEEGMHIEARLPLRAA